MGVAMKLRIAGAILTLIGVMILFSATQGFGARCDRMFPNDPLRVEQCVHRLSRGVEP
jgi:hypothetical protein